MPNAQPSTELTWAGVCLAVYYAAGFKRDNAKRDPYAWTPAKRAFWLQRYLHAQARAARAAAAALWP